jgi:hypothetical protein
MYVLIFLNPSLAIFVPIFMYVQVCCIFMYVPFYFNPSLSICVPIFTCLFFSCFLCMFLFALSLHHPSLYLSSSLSICCFSLP